MKSNEDNLIDWSAFDEGEQKPLNLDGSRQLRIVSIVVLLIAIAGIVLGGTDLNSALTRLNRATSGDVLLASDPGMLGMPLFVIFYGMLTIVPAAFGLQAAKSPVTFVAPTVLGVAGIVGSALCAIVVLVMDAVSGSFEPVLPSYFVVCALAAVAYLFFVVRVHKAANAAGGVVRKRPTKDELWDEKNIWG